MKANPDIYGAVVKLLREVHATKHDTILPDTRLREDLSLDGDDAVAFPIAYVARHEVLNSRVGTTGVAPTW